MLKHCLLALTYGAALVVEGAEPVPRSPLPHHPHDVCSIVALAPNFPQDTTVFSASYGSMNLFLRSRNRGFGWNNRRSGMLGHKISDCEVAPDCEHAELLYVALDEAGLQRSTNGGTTWEPVCVPAKVTQVEAGRSRDGGRLVVCSGGELVGRSLDGGVTWEMLLKAPGEVLSLALSDHDEVVAVGTARHVTMVTAEGNKVAEIPSPAHTIEFSPKFEDDGTLWVGTTGHGLLVSTDRGASFAPVAGETPFAINDVVVAPTWPTCKDIFVASPADGVFVSRDGGAAWTRVDLPVVETYQARGNSYQCLAIASTYPEEQTVYCGCYEGLYCTNDGGENWFEHVINPTRIGRKVAISSDYSEDGTVYMCGYGNPCIRTEDHGQTWAPVTRGMRIMSPYSIATSPQFGVDKTLVVGTHGVRVSRDGGETWLFRDLEPVTPSKLIGSFETRQVGFSSEFSDDRTMFALTAAGFYTSTDAGDTWTGKGVPVDWTWRMSVAPDWKQSGTVFLGGYSVWRSSDMGTTWQRLEVTQKVLGLVCSPDFAESEEVFLVSQQKGLLRSRNRGDTWAAIDAFEGFSPTKIRLSPSYAEDSTLVVSTVSGGMFKSTDRGDTWSRMAALGSESDACFDFVFSPNYQQDQTLFGCTYNGLIQSTDDGATWVLRTDVELYDDERDPWILTGSWRREYYKRAFCYGAHWSETAGDTAALGFSGSEVTLFGAVGPAFGKCDILLDGELVETVDAYAEEFDGEAELFRSQGLAQGFHSLLVRVRGDSHPSSTGRRVLVDAAVVRYAPDDEQNELYADLSVLHLRDGQSRGRDTKQQNQNVEDTRAKIDAEGADSARLEGMIRELTEQVDALRAQVGELQQRLEAQQRALEELRQRRR